MEEFSTFQMNVVFHITHRRKGLRELVTGDVLELMEEFTHCSIGGRGAQQQQ